MKNRCRLSHIFFMVLLVAISAGSLFSQVNSVGPVTLYSERNPSIADKMPAKKELFRYLKMSPVLANVLSYDPTLLSHQEYISSQNPGLAAFLKSHPEITGDPEFYLFGVPMNQAGRGYGDYLTHRDAGFEARQNGRGNDQTLFIIAFFIVVAAIVWLFYMLLQSRRWSRVFKAQTELHAKLLDRFGGSQELLAYLDTDAGRRFGQGVSMDAAQFSMRPELPGPTSRILVPMQFGIVLAVAGIGIHFTRLYLKDSGILLFMGTMAIALGIGLVLAAGLSWYLARRLALASGADRLPANTNAQ